MTELIVGTAGAFVLGLIAGAAIALVAVHRQRRAAMSASVRFELGGDEPTDQDQKSDT